MDQKIRKWWTMDDPRDNIDYVCQEQKEEDWPTMKIEWSHQHKNLKTP